MIFFVIINISGILENHDVIKLTHLLLVCIHMFSAPCTTLYWLCLSFNKKNYGHHFVLNQILTDFGCISQWNLLIFMTLVAQGLMNI